MTIEKQVKLFKVNSQTFEFEFGIPGRFLSLQTLESQCGIDEVFAEAAGCQGPQ